jgi:TRAP-type transport system periplasmic protein
MRNLQKFTAGILGLTLITACPILASLGKTVEEISIGTLVPRSSIQGKSLADWSRTVKKQSGGRLRLKVYYNGDQGDELAMLKKIRASKIDGALGSSLLLSHIYRPILSLEMPGLFTDWASLNRVRSKMASKFAKGAAAAGFYIAGYSDIGLVRCLSKGKGIRSPQDLKGMKVYRPEADLIASHSANIFGYTSVMSSVRNLLSALSSTRINVICVSSSRVQTLQWWSHLVHIGEMVQGVEVGGIVFSKKRLNRLPADLKSILLKSGKKVAKMMTKRMLRADRRAYAQHKKRMTVVTLSDSEKLKWARGFKKVRARLGQELFPPALVKKMEKMTRR